MWRQKIVRIPIGEADGKAGAAKRHSFRNLSPWRRREPLTLQVCYWTRNTCVLRIRARGRTLYVGGHEAIYDVMRTIWNDGR